MFGPITSRVEPFMQLVTWSAWLDQHIPYYEQQRHRDWCGDNPPATVLIVDSRDRRPWRSAQALDWQNMAGRIDDMGYRVKPVFRDTDTHQEWYWAFWSQDEALMAVIKLQ